MNIFKKIVGVPEALGRKLVFTIIDRELRKGVQMLSKDRKTTFLGLISIALAVLNATASLLNGQPVDWTTTVVAITTGAGLVKAADSK